MFKMQRLSTLIESVLRVQGGRASSVRERTHQRRHSAAGVDLSLLVRAVRVYPEPIHSLPTHRFPTINASLFREITHDNTFLYFKGKRTEPSQLATHHSPSIHSRMITCIGGVPAAAILGTPRLDQCTSIRNGFYAHNADDCVTPTAAATLDTPLDVGSGFTTRDRHANKPGDSIASPEIALALCSPLQLDTDLVRVVIPAPPPRTSPALERVDSPGVFSPRWRRAR